MKGGDVCEIVSARCTPKAFAVYCRFRTGAQISNLRAYFRGKTVRKLSDHSPYYVFHADGLRFVFCVGHGRQELDRVFCLVNVEPEQGER